MGGAGCYATQVKLMRFQQENSWNQPPFGQLFLFGGGKGSSLQLTQCMKSFERKVWGPDDIPHVLVYSKTSPLLSPCSMWNMLLFRSLAADRCDILGGPVFSNHYPVCMITLWKKRCMQPHLVLKHFSTMKNHMNRFVAEWWSTPPISAFVFQRQGAIISKSYNSQQKSADFTPPLAVKKIPLLSPGNPGFLYVADTAGDWAARKLKMHEMRKLVAVPLLIVPCFKIGNATGTSTTVLQIKCGDFGLLFEDLSWRSRFKLKLDNDSIGFDFWSDHF